MIWVSYFLEAYQQEVTDNICYQDNKSAMKLEINGKRSTSKITGHIAIRYHFITDIISNKEVSVEHCPTEDMIGDYHTKSLQGTHFRRFRNSILGINEVDVARYNTEARQYIQENNKKLLPAK